MTLIPYDNREGIPLNAAAERAGKIAGMIRNECVEDGMGGVSATVNRCQSRH
jgi:hypothetical protein